MKNVFIPVPPHEELADRLERLDERLWQARHGRYSPPTQANETAAVLQDVIRLVADVAGVYLPGQTDAKARPDRIAAALADYEAARTAAEWRWYSVTVHYIQLTEVGARFETKSLRATSYAQACGMGVLRLLERPGVMVTACGAEDCSAPQAVADADANG